MLKAGIERRDCDVLKASAEGRRNDVLKACVEGRKQWRHDVFKTRVEIRRREVVKLI